MVAILTRRGLRSRWRSLAGLVALALVLGLALGGGPLGAVASAASRDQVTIGGSLPTTFDPGLGSDIGSASATAQLFESLTAFDLSLTLRPALARSWDISDDGRRIVFHLRSGLTFSDGTPLTGADVVGSWLRIIDPDRPSQLASLLLDVRGARDYLAGRNRNPGDVGLVASGGDVTVDLDRPGADFPAIISSPTFGIVPATVWRGGASVDRDGVASSGAYTLGPITESDFTLVANPRYWAGSPAIGTVRVLTTLNGRSPVSAFESGDLDYTEINSFDAAWIRYDQVLGPQLRSVPELSLSYLGFTTNRPPFDDVRVRQAVAAAVDWERVTALASSNGTVTATSMVPPGIAEGGTRNWLPAHDPDRARRLLSEAGFPGGSGFPILTFAPTGSPGEAIAADLKRELGLTIRLEDLTDHFGRLQADPPEMWTLGWIADYPGANDFLGVLLGTGSTNNYGRWSSVSFDAAIDDALATRDPAAALAAYERALTIVRDEAPVIPLSRGDSWALSRNGLLGADESGLGILRLAGLAWQ
ncbi:MAG: peptide ABC transporter substrate-binding protein [Candidatus Limnocylindrales bacterium]